MRRALPLIVVVAPAAALLHCGSFSSTPPAADAAVPDALPSAEASTEAGAATGCAARLSLVGFCADFEDGLTTAWRDDKKENLWKVLGAGAALALVPSGRLAGGTSLEAKLPAAAVGGYLEYAAPALPSVALRFDVRVDVLPPGATGLTIASLQVGSSTVNFRISDSKERLVLERASTSQNAKELTPGYPPLLGNWRTISIVLGGSGAARRAIVQVDEVAALEVSGTEQLPDFSSPQSVALALGTINGGEPGYTVRFDDVRLTAAP